MTRKLLDLALRFVPRTLWGRALLAFVVGFGFTGAAVPQLRFLWASFVHAGL